MTSWQDLMPSKPGRRRTPDFPPHSAYNTFALKSSIGSEIVVHGWVETRAAAAAANLNPGSSPCVAEKRTHVAQRCATSCASFGTQTSAAKILSLVPNLNTAP